MSLHLNRQCQRADAYLPPVRLVPGSVVPTKKRRETATSLDKAASACWRRHIWVALQLVNVLFCKFLARPPFGSLNLARLRRADPKEQLVSCYDLDSSSDTRFKARKSLKPNTFWRRTKGRSESLNGGIAVGRRGASDSLQIATNRGFRRSGCTHASLPPRARSALYGASPDPRWIRFPPGDHPTRPGDGGPFAG
jgi:hypothetical protein